MASNLIQIILSLRNNMKLKLLTEEEKLLAEKIPIGTIKKLHRRYIRANNVPEEKRAIRVKPLDDEFLGLLESIKRTEEQIIEIGIQTEPVSFIRTKPRTKEMGVQCNIASETENQEKHITKSLSAINEEDMIVVKATNYYNKIVSNITESLKVNGKKNLSFVLKRIQNVSYNTPYKHIKTDVAIFSDRELYEANLRTVLRGFVTIVFLSETEEKILSINYQFRPKQQSPLLIETYDENGIGTLVRKTKFKSKSRRFVHFKLTYDNDSYKLVSSIGEKVFTNNVNISKPIKYMVAKNNMDVEYK